MSSIDWVVEVILIAMLGATMFHAFRLERALGMLRRDRDTLEASIATFQESSRQAEGGIDRLRTAATDVTQQLTFHVEQARTLRSDLERLILRGGEVKSEVTDRACGPAPDVAPGSASRQDVADKVDAWWLDAPLRSRAEKELVQALRAVR